MNDNLTVTSEGLTLHTQDGDITIDIPNFSSLGIDPNDLNTYHFYNEVHNVASNKIFLTNYVSDQNIIWENLKEEPAPTFGLFETTNPVTNGSTSSIPIIGDVTHFVDNGNKIVVNVTTDNHMLNPGVVIRHLYQQGDQYYIQSIGVGNGFNLANTNEALANKIWGSNVGRIQRESIFEDNHGAAATYNDPNNLQLLKNDDLADRFSSLGFDNTVINNFKTIGWSALGSNNVDLDSLLLDFGGTNYTVFEQGQTITLPTVPRVDSVVWTSTANTGSYSTNTALISAVQTYIETQNYASPLTFDLDGDGIETTHINDTNVFFDIDGDGYAEKVGWIAPDDGQLAFDRNNDGVINDVTELFGNDVMPAFDKLALLDSNSNGMIDQGDDDYSNLLVWRDLNQDGFSDANEMQSIFDAGIKEISLTETPLNTYQNENYFSGKSTFTRFDGTTDDLVDVHFLNDNSNTWFLGAQSEVYGSTYEINPEALLMPLSRGYGSLPSLHIAMTDNQDLLASMKELVGLDASQFDLLAAKMETFLFQWAGVENNDPDARATGDGANVDARKIDFLEQFSGVDWSQWGSSDAAGTRASLGAKKAWGEVVSTMTARILAQGIYANDIFSEARYDFVSDTLILDASLTDIVSRSQSYVSQYIVHEKAFWLSIGHILVMHKGELGVTIQDISLALDTAYGQPLYIGSQTLTDVDGEIYTAIDGQSENLYINTYVGDNTGNTIEGSSVNDNIFGAEGNDTLFGFEGDDFIRGGLGNDMLHGGSGADWIEASEGDDHLFGGNERDILWGGEGNDILEGGDGDDDLQGGQGADILDGGEGVDEVSYWDSSGVTVNLKTGIGVSGHATGDVYINIENLTGSDSHDVLIGDDNDNTLHGEGGNDELYGGLGNDHLFGAQGRDKLFGEEGNDVLDAGMLLSGQQSADTFDGGEGIDTVRYSHPYITAGVTVNLLTGSGESGEAHNDVYIRIENVVATSYDDTIIGDNNNNYLFGLAGNDLLIGNAGDDSLDAGQGSDILDGGLGRDYLKGGKGDDTYIFSADGDTIYEDGGYDTLEFGQGITLTDLEFERDLSHLKIINTINGESINLSSHFSAEKHEIEALKFSDGSIVELSSIDMPVYGTLGDDYLTVYGTSQEFLEIHGLDGNDSIYAYGNSAVIYGGGGDDRVLFYGTGSSLLYGEDGSDFLKASDGDSLVYGGRGDDVVNGGDGDDFIYGGEGNDKVSGGNGIDVLDGGTGDDTVFARNGDTVIFSEGNDVLWSNESNLKFTDQTQLSDISLIRHNNYNGQNDLLITMNATQDSLTAEDHFLSDDSSRTGHAARFLNIIEFEDGQTIDLKQIQYTTHGNDDDNYISGILEGGLPDDIIYGFAGNDKIDGQSGDDVIYGGDGNDTITSNLGNDTLNGDAGDDTFKIGVNAGAITIILDFESLNLAEKIDLSAFNFKFSHFSTFENNISQVGDDTQINLGDGQIIRLENVLLADIDENDFIGNISNNSSLIAQNDFFTLVEDSGAVIIGNVFSDNGSGIDTGDFSETFTVTEINQNGFVLDANGDFTFTLEDDVSGIQTFDYTVTNIQGLSASAIISFDVAAINDAPVAAYDEFAALLNENISGNLLNDNGYGADEDVEDGNSLNVTAEVKSSSQSGNVEIQNNGYFTYTPSNNFSGIDSFTYTISDSEGSSETSNVKIYVVPDSQVVSSTSSYFGYQGTDQNEVLRGNGGYYGIQDKGGDDFVIGTGGDNKFYLGSGSDFVFGGEGRDTVITTGSSSGAHVDLVLGKVDLENDGLFEDTIINIEDIIGSGHSDILKGDDDKNDIEGGEGDDLIYGQAGNDTLEGGEGNDTIYGGDGNDRISSHEFYTYNHSYNGQNLIYGGNGNDRIYLSYGSDTVYAGDGDDVITAINGDYAIDGGEGIDAVDYNYGTSYYGIYGSVHVDLSEGRGYGTIAGNHTYTNIENISGTYLDDVLIGSDDDNLIVSYGGNDIIDGKAGDDTLWALFGNSILTGGQGVDLFKIYSASNSLHIITDFDVSSDHIEFYSSTNFTSYFDLRSKMSQVGDGVEIQLSINSSLTLENIQVSDLNAEHFLGAASSNTLLQLVNNSEQSIEQDSNLTITASMLRITDFESTDLELTFIVTDILSNTTLLLDGLVLNIGDQFSMRDVYDQNLTIQPDSSFIGSIGFDFYATDGENFIEIETFEVNVEAPNQAPIAQADFVYTLINESIENNVFSDNGNGLDIDPDGNSLHVISGIVMTAEGGTADISANGNFIYSPALGYVGTDTFMYTLFDGHGASSQATVSITINATNFDDEIYGNAENNSLIGHAGDDVLIGYAGDDTLDGGADIDTVDYSSATSGVVVSLLHLDWIYDSTNTIAASTAYDGLGGTDTLLNVENIIGSDHKDYLRGSNSFASTISAGAGHDYIIGQGHGDVIYAGTGNDFVSASGGDDLVYGDTGRDNIFGGNGNDELHSGDGDDWINGGNGDDLIYGDDGLDILTGGAGNDTMYGGAGNDLINSNDGNDVLYGGSGDDTMRGYQGDDELHGGDGNDLMFGGQSINDTFDSDDVLYGDAGNDILYGLGGNDTMYGGEGNDNLYGYDDNDTLRGEGGIDTLRGGAGDDVLYSEGDRDILFGEAGADTFAFEGMSAYDDLTFVQDFDASEGDVLDISNILTGFVQGTSDINDYLTFSEAAGHTFVWADSNGADAGGNYSSVVRLTNETGLDIDALFNNGNIVV